MANLIVGCGYLGSRVSDRWVAAGEAVHAVTRSAKRAESMRLRGLNPIVADITQPVSLKGLPACETVLVAVGFDRRAGLPISEVYVQGLSNVLAALPVDVGRVIYISSTGVYGQTDGSWVDEQSACTPMREGGKACLAAEDLLRDHPLGDRAVILRMAGIYGPGRVPRLNKLKDGEPIPAAKDGFLNLIHVEDAANIVVQTTQIQSPPKLYCVSDGQPVERRTYYQAIAETIGVASPRFTPLQPDAHAARRAESNKRVSNKRLLDEVQPLLRFPSYREGLQAILETEAQISDVSQG